MNSYKVSIIVLTYNNFSNLKDNLNSIKKQRFKDYEVIIHDDGSKLFDYDYINKLCNGIKHYSIFHKDVNAGTVKNYNDAIKKSLGEIIVPLSQDDVFIDNDSLGKIVSYFKKTHCNVCTSKRKGRLTGKISPSEYEVLLLKEANNEKIWLRCVISNFISGAVTFYRKDYLEKIGYFDEDFILIEDFSMIMKLLNNETKISFLDEVTLLYGEEGVTGINVKPSEKILNDNILTYEKYILPYIDKTDLKLANQYIYWKYHKWQQLKDGSSVKITFRMFVFLIYTKLISTIFKNINCNELRYKKLEKKLCE